MKVAFDVQEPWGRVQADLIDMRRVPAMDRYGRMVSWILHVRDHGTRFSILRSLVRKTAAEVALELSEIFATFGPPVILHTDNGTEFVGRHVVDEVRRLCPDIRFVRGRPRHPQTQGLVERANAIAKRQLRKLLSDANRPLSDWPLLLASAALNMNTSYNRTIESNAFMLMFGRRNGRAVLDGLDASVVLDEASLSKEVLGKLGLGEADITTEADHTMARELDEMDVDVQGADPFAPLAPTPEERVAAADAHRAAEENMEGFAVDGDDAPAGVPAVGAGVAAAAEAAEDGDGAPELAPELTTDAPAERAAELDDEVPQPKQLPAVAGGDDAPAGNAAADAADAAEDGDGAPELTELTTDAPAEHAGAGAGPSGTLPRHSKRKAGGRAPQDELRRSTRPRIPTNKAKA